MGWPAKTRAKWLAFAKVSAGLVGLAEMRAEWPSIARKRAGAIIFSRISTGALTFVRSREGLFPVAQFRQFRFYYIRLGALCML